MLKILTVIGARPQFIKCAPVSNKLRHYFTEIIVHTGQHYDNNLSQVFFDQLSIPTPDYHLNVGSESHSVQTAKILIELEKVIHKVLPNIILVYGDTNSTLAAAIVAAKMLIPLVHIEAGLRSYNKKMPEELNRICTDHYSDVLFCPGEKATKNLKKEGIIRNVFNVGDVMKDAVLQFEKKIDPAIIYKKYNLKPEEPFLFFTVHRQENTDELKRLKKIFANLTQSPLKIIFPIHPRTKKIVTTNEIILPNNIIVVEPVDYIESIALQKLSNIVITDSGGIQKEAYFLRTPCITLREETEWEETVESGMNTIVGIDKEKYFQAHNKYLNYKLPESLKDYYGDGNASEKIANILRKIYE